MSGNSPYQRLNFMLSKLKHAMQHNPLLTEAMTRAYVFADASAASEVDHVEKLIDIMFARDGRRRADRGPLPRRSGDLGCVAVEPAGLGNRHQQTAESGHASADWRLKVTKMQLARCELSLDKRTGGAPPISARRPAGPTAVVSAEIRLPGGPAASSAAPP